MLDNQNDKVYSTNNNVLITADGEMGENKISSESGAGGVAAGSISSSNSKYTRVGFDGLGGYGGNGAVSVMDIGGTTIANAGSNAGKNGGTRLRNETQYSGNAGVCRPGTTITSYVKGIRSVNDDEYYGAGIESITVADYPQDSIDELRTGGNIRGLFELAVHYRYYNEDVADWNRGGPKQEEVQGRGENLICPDNITIIKDSKITNVYVRAQIKITFWELQLPWKQRFIVASSKIIVWTSGEIVNSGTFGKSFDEAWGFSGKVCG